jgi:hypothetical protein
MLERVIAKPIATGAAFCKGVRADLAYMDFSSIDRRGLPVSGDAKFHTQAF